MIELRDYQHEMLGRLESAWEKHRSVMVQMPTGTGKTVLLAEVIKRHTEGRSKGKVLIVAHRRELIEQIQQTLSAFEMRNEECGMRNDDYSEAESGVVVESIQKISRRFKSYAEKSDFQLVIVDEAHHALAKTYRVLWETWPEARFLGLTATPCRLSGEPLAEMFDVLLQSWSILEFIDRGWLSDFEYVSAAPDSRMARMVAGLKKRGADGDYQTKEMATVMDVPESIEHLYRTYERFAAGKKGIVYAIDQQHARHIAEFYRSQGVRCEVIDSRTPAEERKRLVEAYRDGELLDVLVNVDIFGEGFDVPEVEFIQLARPTLSLSKYLQQVGRGMRVSKGKPHVLILDNAGLYLHFGLPTDEHDWKEMFSGWKAGMSPQKKGEPIVRLAGKDEDSRTLENLEMVRIKSGGQRKEGLEVFMQGGKYGVMVDGEVTCPAEFERLEMLDNKDYFAMAIYPYAVFRGRVTVIDRQGRDMKAALYGHVTNDGDFFGGLTLNGNRVYWDGVGGRYFSRMPQFEEIAGVEMVQMQDGKYLPRMAAPYLKEPVGKKEIFFNNNIVWMKDVLIVKGNKERKDKIYDIHSFGPGMFIVSELRLKMSGISFTYVGLDGVLRNVGPGSFRYSDYSSKKPWGGIRLMRATTGKYEMV